MNRNFVRFTIPCFIFTLGFWGAISTIYSLKGVSESQTEQQTSQSVPLLEFRRQKPGTEAQFSTESQTLWQLKTEREELQKTGNAAAIERNQVALEKSYRAIANLFEPVNLDSSCLLDARTQPTQGTSWEISVVFNDECGQKFAELTKTVAGTGRSIGIFVRGKIVSSPIVDAAYANTGITGGRAVITGSFTKEEAQDLAEQLNRQTRVFRESTPEGKAYTLVQLAQKKLEQKDYQNAIADFTQAIRLYPKNLDAYLGRGNAKYGIEDYQGAIADYTEVIRSDSKNIDAYLARAQAKFALKDYQGSTEDYELVSKINPSYLSAIASPLLLNYIVLGAKQKAIDLVTQIGDATPFESTIKASVFLAFDDYEATISECDRALQNYPQDTLAYLYRAIAYDELDNKDAATKDYQQILQIDPQNTLPPELSEIFPNIEEIDPTLKSLEARLLAQAYYVRGVARYKLEDLQGAIADLDRSIELNPDYSLAYRMRGVTREALQDEQGATADFQKAAELLESQSDWIIESSDLSPSPFEEIYRRRK